MKKPSKRDIEAAKTLFIAERMKSVYFRGKKYSREELIELKEIVSKTNDKTK